MNILITGHSGFIGSHATDYFVQHGHIVHGVTRSSSNKEGVHSYNIDITNYDALSRLINEKCIDVVVHFAGKPLVADCEKDPFNAFKINGLGTASVLESARYAKVKKTIVIETDKVYGLQKVVPTNESAVPNPKSPYEFSKVLATTFCDFYRTYYNMNVISVRPVNVFGPGDYSFSRIIPAAMRNISLGEGIPVQEHAINIHRDFIYVKDVAKMIYILSTGRTTYDVYNLSCNESISILKLAEKITDILEHTVKPIIVKKPGTYSEISYQAIYGSRFINEFNFKFTSFDVAIKETYKAYCEKFNLSILGR